mgnify:CR=1 FL=1
MECQFRSLKNTTCMSEHKASGINMILNHMKEHHDTEPSKVKAQSPREDSDIAENAI